MASTEVVKPTKTVDELNQLYQDYWEFALQESPLLATYLGDHRYDDRLDDVSEEAYHRRISKYLEYQKHLANLGRPKSRQDILNYDLFERRLHLLIEQAGFQPYLLPITQQEGAHIEFPQVTTYHPFQAVNDYKNYSNRLRLFNKLVDQIISCMKKGIRERIVLPRVLVERIIPQLDAQLVSEPEKSEFYKPVKSLSPGLSDGDKREIAGKVEDAIMGDILPAYSKLRGFVADEYLPSSRDSVGEWDLPDGEQRYMFDVRFYTTTTYTPDEIHSLGLKELENIHKLMRETVRRARFSGTVQSYAEHLRNDKAMYYSTGRELLEGFKKILAEMDSKLPLLFGRLPKAPYDFREIEEYRAEAAPDAYYYNPPADGSRPGYFYVNTYKPGTRPKYTMEALAYHEAVPGHHLQLAVQQELSELPKFRRFGGYTVFIEGWALYSERLPKEVGLYRSVESEFGRLTLDAWRASRLVVDTGIHHKRWTREQAIQFMKENTALSEHNIISEVDRYISWPGQALAYKIGQMKISELRNSIEKRLGGRFEIRAFHDELLADGAIPLDALEEKMGRRVGSISV